MTSPSARPPASAGGLASWYMPGMVDGFGDRLLMFDNADTEALELLRFHPSLVATPGFEDVLRERVRALRPLVHPAFPAIRAVQRLDGEGSLALVSAHTPGKRLSAILSEPRLRSGLHPMFVTWVVRQVIQPLLALHGEGADVAHGALTADRVVLAPDGRVRVVEQVLGSALRQIDPSPARLWKEFGLAAPVDARGVPQFDARTDVFQVGVLALSMLLGRRITPADLDEQLPRLLYQWSHAVPAQARVRGELTAWLERALRVGGDPYRSAAEAYSDLHELPAASPARAMDYLHAGDEQPPVKPLALIGSHSGTEEATMSHRTAFDAVHGDSTTVPATLRPQEMPGEIARTEQIDTFPVEHDASARDPRLLEFPPAEPARRGQAETPVAAPVRVTVTLPSRTSLIAGILGVIALVEGVVIAALLMRSPFEVVTVAAAAPTAATAAAAGRYEAPAAVGIPPGDASAVAPVAVSATLETSERQSAAAAAIARAASTQRSGGVRLTSPIELKVLLGDRVLGSTADGPVVATAGTHQLELLNSTLGFRTMQTVTFRAGEITTVSVPVPQGRISINAQPWAQVSIDGRSVGETPLANVDIAIGEHEVVFRHPELGERRQTVTVRADTVARVSASFSR